MSLLLVIFVRFAIAVILLETVAIISMKEFKNAIKIMMDILEKLDEIIDNTNMCVCEGKPNE